MKKKFNPDEIVKREENRKVYEQKDGKIRFELNEKQWYSKEQKDNMIKEWKKELKEMSNWLNNHDRNVEEQIKHLKEQMNIMKGQVEDKLRNTKEALETWSNIVKEE